MILVQKDPLVLSFRHWLHVYQIYLNLREEVFWRNWLDSISFDLPLFLLFLTLQPLHSVKLQSFSGNTGILVAEFFFHMVMASMSCPCMGTFDQVIRLFYHDKIQWCIFGTVMLLNKSVLITTLKDFVSERWEQLRTFLMQKTHNCVCDHVCVYECVRVWVCICPCVCMWMPSRFYEAQIITHIISY